MEVHLALLLLLATGVLGQEDAAADEGGDGGDAAVCKEDCEESWAYVEFLKKDISDEVTGILTNFKTTQDGDKAVEETMSKVMSIRETILKRIKDLRKGEEEVCFGHNVKQEEKLSDFRMNVMQILLELVKIDASSIENLRKVGDDLVKFRGVISAEVMRVLMLPAPCKSTPAIPTDCPNCDALEKVKKALEKLRECATDKDEDAAEDDEQAEEGAEDAAAEDGAAEEEGGECMEPPMFSMDLILANEELDKAIAELYNQIIQSTNETERGEHLGMLTMLKDVREQIDDHIGNLLEEDEPEKIKKYVTSTMRGFIIDIGIKYKDCFETNQCAGGPECDSCGATKVDEMRDKMRQYKSNLDSQREEEDKKVFIREDLINFINKINGEARGLLKEKVNSDTGVLAKCEQEQLKVIDDCKGPMWMLVNTTIFDTLENVVAMVNAMDEQLKLKRGVYCKEGPVPPPTNTNCEWEEYENTREYLVEVDNVIQKGLFKTGKKTETLIGFVDIQAMFDKRVKKLFEDEVRCPAELEQIKKKYMIILNRCMISFMNPKVDFEDLNRFQRISCIKELRNELEDRTAKLLQFELNASLSAIDEEQAPE